MIFGIYLSVKVTNQNRIIRTSFRHETVTALWNFKQNLRNAFHRTFTFTRKAALPLLVTIVVVSLAFKEEKENNRWDEVESSLFEAKTGRYLGIFHPAGEDGLVDLEEINTIEARQNINFDIISFYLAWTEKNANNFPFELLNSIWNKNAIPMITWEPWASHLKVADSIPELQKEEKVFKHISAGIYDNYIINFAKNLAQYDKPVFLRFAHEFDNPFYPWSKTGKNTPDEFKNAWNHIHRLLTENGANEVILVWNPWKSTEMQQYYPGNETVDWIGITALNYGPLNPDRKHRSFEELYQVFHDSLATFSNKPVMLSEFGSVKFDNLQDEWISNAIESIETKYGEVNALILFDSARDKNIPKNNWYKEKYIDWTNKNLEVVKDLFARKEKNIPTAIPRVEKLNDRTKIGLKLGGVRYKKSESWQENYYVVTKDVLLKDLQLMKDAGLTTIHFKGGNVYEYNLLKFAKEQKMDVIYEFDLDIENGLIGRQEELREVREEILQKVRKFKSNEAILAYSFNGNLEEFFTEPLVYYQRQAFLVWFQELSRRIKEIDPEKALVLDIPFNQDTRNLIADFDDHVYLDSYGLIMTDTTGFSQFKDYADRKNISVFVSSVSPATFAGLRSKGSKVVYQNWQDERLSNRVSFDGLLDFEGRQKLAYRKVQAQQRNIPYPDAPEVRILKPAVGLVPGTSATYTTVFYKGGEWKAEPRYPSKYAFEWSLVKLDSFGNPLAVKEIGTGSSIAVEIPENYKNYRLLLSVVDLEDNLIIQKQSLLHTPLE